MNRETRPGSRTKFSPWFGLLHVNLGCFIHHNIHELVKALQKTNEGRSASSYCALESSTENGAGGGGCEDANMDANTKGNFRFTIHPDTTGAGVFKLQRGVWVGNARTIIRPSMRISMLSYSQITTFALCK
jgi:hypothetical protein